MLAAMVILVLTGLLRGVRTHHALVLENLALRHQLAVLQRTAARPRLRPCDRLFWVLLSRLWHGWAEAVAIVQPETVIRWHRAGFRLFWTWKSRRNGPGRPAVARRCAHSSIGWPRPIPCGARPAFTGSSASLVSRSPRPRSPSTWSTGGRRRHPRPGGTFSPTTWERSSP